MIVFKTPGDPSHPSITGFVVGLRVFSSLVARGLTTAKDWLRRSNDHWLGDALGAIALFGIGYGMLLVAGVLGQ